VQKVRNKGGSRVMREQGKNEHGKEGELRGIMEKKELPKHGI
jgi:hypothetical protein